MTRKRFKDKSRVQLRIILSPHTANLLSFTNNQRKPHRFVTIDLTNSYSQYVLFPIISKEHYLQTGGHLPHDLLPWQTRLHWLSPGFAKSRWRRIQDGCSSVIGWWVLAPKLNPQLWLGHSFGGKIVFKQGPGLALGKWLCFLAGK